MLDRLPDIPDKPGVYIFKDKDNSVLYVGKAKGLRSRVRSYFQKSSSLDERKSGMMKMVNDLEYTVTGNELEAFILEANLIKQYRPRFNVLLRDDKSYPYLKLTINETWPRLEVVRRIKKDGARYFGPYVPSGDMWNILAFIRNTFRIPTCTHTFDRSLRPCIQHQIKRCIAPCGGGVDHAEYMNIIQEIRLLLEGRNRKLLEALEGRMQRCSEELRFEEAAVLRDRISAIRKISESQKVVAPELGDLDVIGLSREGGKACFRLLFVRNGIMIGYRQFALDHTAGVGDGYLMKSLIEQFYSKEILPPGDIVCSLVPEDHPLLSEWLSGKREGRVSIFRPVRGIKRKLVDMAVENAAMFLKTYGAKDSPGPASGIGQELADLLGLIQPPSKIGAFDISNISGSEPVGGFVYWMDGGFRKDRYRHIRMDAVKGPDDYAMMKEMVRRTFEKEGQREGDDTEDRQRVLVPDLVIIDGGKGQLDAAIDALSALGIRTCVISIAKDPDRAFIPGRDLPVGLEDGGRAALLLRRIRDEVHRFSVQYHKKLRARRTFESPLEKIPGIGRKRRLELLRHFGSLEGVRHASAEEISKVKGFTREVTIKLLEGLKDSSA
ncbi:MAG: excinuclease ABC subunit UvrC [Nitrospiraceae bacterium]|nr:excinuclease ABC subunit UvrC [Nitrospiraceae bacterium]